MKHYDVVGAIIEFEGRILCMQRAVGKYEYTSLKWEFPGGKIEEGETKPQALMRELHEEMELDVYISENDYFISVEHAYPDFEITMHCYWCHPQNDRFIRKEHVDHKWLNPCDMKTLDWAAADIPVVEMVMRAFVNEQ